MAHPVIERAETALRMRLECAGNVTLLDAPRRLLLISRAQRNPAPDTPWLAAAAAATRSLAQQGEALVAGPGRVAWDAALWAHAHARGHAIVALPEAPTSARVALRFIPKDGLVVWPTTPWPKGEANARRDLLLSCLADRAYAIHVRKGGNMAVLREALLARGCPVEPWPVAAPAPLPPLGGGAGGEGPRANQAPFPLLDGRYLTHFTRAPDGPWPGEDYGDYLAWLCSGPAFSPRDAFAALCRILQEKRIRACGRLMPGNAPMVCFTARRPEEILALRQWRTGLRRWTFEPYGLAIVKEALSEQAQSVRYVNRETLRQAPLEQRCFMQIERSANTAWPQEDEWRMQGDVDLSGVAASQMVAVVARPNEAQQIHERFGIAAVVLPQPRT